jgi:hypothetical protein
MTVTRPILAIVLATGCGTTISATQINTAPRPMQPRPPHTVQIFTSGPPQRPYVDIAFLEAEQTTDLSVDGTAEFFVKLRGRAAAMGCDGIVIGQRTNRATQSILELSNILTPKNQTDFGVQNIKGLTATCIVYTDEDTLAAHGVVAAVPPVPAAAPTPPPPAAAPANATPPAPPIPAAAQ